MPKWGLSMKEGKVAGWLVGEGDSLTPGDEVIDIETEKISSAVEAADAGVLRRCVAQEGDVLPVGGLLGIVADESVADADIDAFVTDFQANFVPPEDDDEDSGPATETVEIDGRQIRYLTRGEGGTPVILIHGFGGDLNNWCSTTRRSPRRGRSTPSTCRGTAAPARMRATARSASSPESSPASPMPLGIEKAHLVGHSMGGAIALAMARSAPARVASITLIGSAGLGSEIDGDYLEGFISAERRKGLKPHVEKLFSDPALVTRQLINDLLAFKRIDGVTAALGTIRDAFAPGGAQAEVMRDVAGSVPTLVLWGAGDQIIPASHAEGLPDGVDCTVLDGQGHMVQMEAATEVNRLIDKHVG
ncbi:Dihydrolipoyllysine-residue acetyltransferase component of acetoin cleaving system [Geodia barretti]|nr:Dihydrolipoyllysine-residue acetyltransferase component of acetoin cleaving system [Geodia barretti]